MTKRRSPVTRKAKPFQMTPVPDLSGKGPGDTVTRAQLVALIASRVQRDQCDDETTARNKVSSKVSYDVGNGKLSQFASGIFELGAISDWASQEWPGVLDELLPKQPRTGGLAGTITALTLSASGHTLPQSLEAAHLEIDTLYKRLVLLAPALAATEDKLRAASPKAEKWDTMHRKKRGRRQR